MLKIVKHSHFNADPFGHGGNKRTAQIDELLTDAGIVFKNADFAFTGVSGSKAKLYLDGFIHNRNILLSHKHHYATGRYLKMFEAFIQQERPGLFILEAMSEYYLLLAEVLFKHHVPVIALPHNLESLVAGSQNIFSLKAAPFWYFEELQYFNFCRKAFTISREESWLLSCSGISAGCLPYYPPRPAEQYFLSIRQRRAGKQNQAGKIKVLLIGTFYNKPTADGYTELLLAIQHEPGLELFIAGFGSEQLKTHMWESHVHILGAVDNQVLSELIINCDYAVVHQQPSSGALTRIPELLLAGIPVLANEHAARSAYDLEGLLVYHSCTDLPALLRAPVPIVTQPERSLNGKSFTDYIKTML